MSRKNPYGPYIQPNGHTTWKRLPMKVAEALRSPHDLLTQALTGNKVGKSVLVTEVEKPKRAIKAAKPKQGLLKKIKSLVSGGITDDQAQVSEA